ncbi:LiaF transmembrane domain-containing protein [Lederbergia lenta]|uniref:Putative lipoprotein n=1 Tax=Lederbergia lenta TaxID=1467 RepID=A0A2X4VMV1_LEDLE|nr:hypothetical protein [Lederbergia lenta]MEC2325931.1 hypothetical protein [Lederbergia lenta]SQI53507.1 putative lipoprotein [Lederbergia lenta]
MRTWRVGSFSMGAALVLLGVFLLLSQFLKWDPAIAMISWWPLLFIILGVEILLYLGFSKSEKQQIKYDFISIIFISIIGTFGLGMAVVNATGLLEVSKQFVIAEERTLDLPKFEEELTNEIKRVYIETGPYSLNVEGSQGEKAVMFGTYRGDMKKGDHSIKSISDYALIEKQGDTLYIKLKRAPMSRFMNYNDELNATILIPSNVELELIGEHNNLNLKPRDLQSNWSIASVGNVNMDIAENANMKIQAVNVQEAGEADWQEVQGGKSNNQDEDNEYEESIPLTGTLTYGSGKYTIKVKDSYTVEIN